MYKHKVFAVVMNILPIHQSIYTVNALAPTRLPATICIAIAMALTSQCMHLSAAVGLAPTKPVTLTSAQGFYSNCYQKLAERNCNGWIHCNLCWSWNNKPQLKPNPTFSKTKLSQHCKDEKKNHKVNDIKWSHVAWQILTAQMHPPNISHWLRREKKMPKLPNMLNKNI